MKDAFRKTRIPNISKTIKETFGMKEGELIYQDACLILEAELQRMYDRGNKAIRNHLRKNLLPGFASYKALLNAGVEQEKAVDFIENEMCKAVESTANLCRMLSNKSYAFIVFKTAFGLGMKFGFPKQGWTVEYVERSNRAICMNITSCLYCEELEKRDAIALCRAFCRTDHAAYDPLAPAVVFKRKATLAQTGKQCDFCFERRL